MLPLAGGVHERQSVGRFLAHDAGHDATVAESDDGGPVALHDLPGWLQDGFHQVRAVELPADERQIRAGVTSLTTDAMARRATRRSKSLKEFLASFGVAAMVQRVLPQQKCVASSTGSIRGRSLRPGRPGGKGKREAQPENK